MTPDEILKDSFISAILSIPPTEFEMDDKEGVSTNINGEYVILKFDYVGTWTSVYVDGAPIVMQPRWDSPLAKHFFAIKTECNDRRERQRNGIMARLTKRILRRER